MLSNQASNSLLVKIKCIFGRKNVRRQGYSRDEVLQVIYAQKLGELVVNDTYENNNKTNSKEDAGSWSPLVPPLQKGDTMA